MNSYLIDPIEFCKQTQNIKGTLPVSEMQRLLPLCAAPTGTITWQVEGSLDALRRPQLLLNVSGQIELICQRCLEAMSYEVASQTKIIVAKTEEQANLIEETLEDEDNVEVIVSESKTDLLVIVEDEVLLSLPLSPRHEVCPNNATGQWTEKQSSPFEVLKNMKKMTTKQ